MKKRNLKSLQLNKKSISIITSSVQGGALPRTLMCQLDPIGTPLEPITVPNSNHSVCICGTFLC